MILFLDNVMCHPESMIGQFCRSKSFSYQRIQLQGTTTGCWHHPKFQGQVPKQAG